MDNIATRIASVTSTLAASDKRLKAIESSIQTHLAPEINAMQRALQGGQHVIQHTFQQTSGYLKQLEANPTPDSQGTNVDLTPQIEWLRASVKDILHFLNTAQGLLERSLQTTMSSNSSVLDIRQQVNACLRDVAECKGQLTTLETGAQEALDSANESVRGLERQIASTTAEITSASRQTEEKQTELRRIQEQIHQTETKISSTEGAIRETREARNVARGLGILGFLAAPFTGGASLILAAGGTIGVVITEGDLTDLHRAKQNLQSQQGSLRDEVSQHSERISALERGKCGLEDTLKQHQHDLSSQQAQHQEIKLKLESASRLLQDLVALKTRLDTSAGDVSALDSGLTELKQRLDTLSAGINTTTVDIQETNEDGLGKTGRRYARFLKRKEAMGKIVGVLDRAHGDIPQLLASSLRGVKLLQSSGEVTVSVEVKTSPIPGMVFFA